MRLIDADKIPVIFEPVAYSNDCPIALDRETVEELVKHCSVDAKMITHAKWGDKNECSLCGCQPWFSHDIRFLKYCPECGARMDGEA